MSLQENIQQDLIAALKTGEDLKLATLRLLQSEIKNETISQSEELNDKAIFTVIAKEIKKRRDASEAYRKAGRAESAQKEQAELKILEQYLPRQMGEAELGKLVDLAIEQFRAAGPADIGKVIGLVVSQTQGQADGGRIALLVKNKLAPQN